MSRYPGYTKTHERPRDSTGSLERSQPGQPAEPWTFTHPGLPRQWPQKPTQPALSDAGRGRRGLAQRPFEASGARASHQEV
ncbi:hypothetical protein BD777DRAFT_121501 [Yarrowia lipolytica]|nr:hypothetical protein BD777DRAFT_121501 [Yarrowia lipolytica]